jgi:hypothetical protein
MCSPCDRVRDPMTKAPGYKIKTKNYKDHHFAIHEQPYLGMPPSCNVRNCTYLQQKTPANLPAVMLKEMLEDKQLIQELRSQVCGVIFFVDILHHNQVLQLVEALNEARSRLSSQSTKPLTSETEAVQAMLVFLSRYHAAALKAAASTV